MEVSAPSIAAEAREEVSAPREDVSVSLEDVSVSDEDVSASTPSLSTAFGNLFDELLRYATAKLESQGAQWFDDLERAMLSRGPYERAIYEATKAHLQGKNPIWAGAKGAWAGASVPQRVAAVVILVLLALLAPVALLLLILGLLIAALVAAIRAAKS